MDPEAWQLLLAAELPQNRLRALREELGAFPSADAVRSWKGYSKAEEDRVSYADMKALQGALEAGARIVEARQCSDVLQATDSVPPALFAWGDTGCLNEPTVAIVGTRQATTYGRATAQKFAEALTRAGVVVVSGGAIGIDAAAHKGSLAAGGKTIAVLGNGIDKAYPMLHRGLFQQIRENGCLVSQFAAGSAPSGYRFLVRNNLIAAISRALLVVEAPERSGALSTANSANEMGRQVFVVPANIDNEKYRGSHSLIRNGATLVDHPDQILEDLGITPVLEMKAACSPASAIQEKILSAMSVDPLAAEFIAERTGIDAAAVMSELTMLELDGRIMRDAGGYALLP